MTRFYEILMSYIVHKILYSAIKRCSTDTPKLEPDLPEILLRDLGAGEGFT